jgi:nitric oxide reductase activation protein
MTESTMNGLTRLFPDVAPGGFPAANHYEIEESRQAVEESRREQGIGERIERID